MKDYELKVCEALQLDIKNEFNVDWDLVTIYNFWSAWSEFCFAGWMGYKQGEIQLLNEVVEIMWDQNFGENCKAD